MYKETDRKKETVTHKERKTETDKQRIRQIETRDGHTDKDRQSIAARSCHYT